VPTPLFEVEKDWRWSGVHYQRAALDWLANFDAHHAEIEIILSEVYGSDAPLWMRRWHRCGAGAGSSSPPRACSVTPAAANGASAIIG
jgi:cyclopropane fatty-acyl-phospholipid synthase-like methyltransferase